MRVLVRRSNAKTWLVECNTDYCLSVRLLSHCLLCLIVKLIKGDFSFFCWYVMHLRLFFRSTVVSNLTNINLKGHFLTMWASSLLKESTAASKVVQTRSEEHLQSETHVLQLMSEAQDADGQKRLSCLQSQVFDYQLINQKRFVSLNVLNEWFYWICLHFSSFDLVRVRTFCKLLLWGTTATPSKAQLRSLFHLLLPLAAVTQFILF